MQSASGFTVSQLHEPGIISKAFKCALCSNKAFRTRAQIHQHLAQVHSAVKPFKCDICPAACATRGRLVTHLSIHSRNPCRLQCDACGSRLSSKASLRQHQRRMHRSVEFQCARCGKRYRSRLGLEDHMLKSHLNVRPSSAVQCGACRAVFVTKRQLHQHNQQRHFRRPYVCARCGGMFVDKATVIAHQATFHSTARPYACAVCEQRFKRSQLLRVHLKLHRRASFRCRVCSREFTFFKDLQLHRRRHMRVFCAVCGHQASSRRQLFGHVYEVHHPSLSSDYRLYQCDICSKSYPAFASLMSHKKNIHPSGAVHIRCIICGKAFRRLNALAWHQRAHRAHPCATCGKSFRLASMLRVHQRVHENVRRYHCGICAKSFKNEAHYRKHVKNHGFCAICLEACSSKHLLVQHLARKCASPQPRSVACTCRTCGKRLCSPQIRRRHEALHATERPPRFEARRCARCYERCVDKERLARHLRRNCRPVRKIRPPKLIICCALCGERCISKERLVRHLKRNCKPARKQRGVPRNVRKQHVSAGLDTFNY